MDKKEELKGLLKETLVDTYGADIDDIKEKAAVQEETNAKLLEDNVALKAEMDSWQNKEFTLKQNTGEHKYIFKGYDVNRPTMNFKIDCSKEVQEEAATIMKDMILGKAVTTTNTLMPTEYSNSLLGLAELKSVMLAKCRIINTPSATLKVPTKSTRASEDAQAFGTANTAAATATSSLTFTIDKRIGSYESVYNDVLADSNFDIIGEWVEPTMAEAIGQAIDGECMKLTEFTSDITAGGTVAVTASGSVAIAAAVTFANLNTMYYGLPWERGLSGEWFMSRPTMAKVAGLVDNQARPIFQQVPVNGVPSQILMGAPVNIVPTMSDTPANGSIRMCFGDPKQYIIALRQGLVFDVNPYVQMKEGITQYIMYARADGNIVDATAFQLMKRAD